MTDRPERVLLVRLSALGDVVHVLPALGALRQALPGAHLAWAVEPHLADLLVDHPDLDEVLVYPRYKRGRGVAVPADGGSIPRTTVPGMLAFFRELRARRFDWALDFHGNVKAGLVVRGSGARVRAGFVAAHAREWNPWVLNRRIDPGVDVRHRIHRNLGLIEGLGLPVDRAPVRLGLTPAQKGLAASLWNTLPAGGRKVAIHPGASVKLDRKRWPPEHFAGLATRLVGRDDRILLLSGPGEEDLLAPILSAGSGRIAAAPQLALRELAAVLAGADLYVGVDSGPLQLATALQVPVVALFGLKDPAVYGPIGGPAEVLHPEGDCPRCGERFCEHADMARIGIDAVAAAVDRLVPPTR